MVSTRKSYASMTATTQKTRVAVNRKNFLANGLPTRRRVRSIIFYRLSRSMTLTLEHGGGRVDYRSRFQPRRRG